jgi:hypothetical protein
MTITELLLTRSLGIMAKASNALSRAHLRSYEKAGEEATNQKLQALYNHVTLCVESKNAAPLVKYVEDIARTRFFHGVQLSEVQTVFNVLEEAIWKEMQTTMTPEEFVDGVGVLSTVFGLGKDALARAFLALASKRHAPTLDIGALSKGQAAAQPVYTGTAHNA